MNIEIYYVSKSTVVLYCSVSSYVDSSNNRQAGLFRRIYPSFNFIIEFYPLHSAYCIVCIAAVGDYKEIHILAIMKVLKARHYFQKLRCVELRHNIGPSQQHERAMQWALLLSPHLTGESRRLLQS